MTALAAETAAWAKCTFEDLLDYIQPTNYIVDSTEYDDSFPTPVLTAGKSFIKGYTNEKHGIFQELPTIIFDDFTTATQFVNFPFKVKSSAMKILVACNDLVNLKFLYFYMQANPIRSDTHKRYWISVYAKKALLLPPKKEQERIVARIDELFSELDKGVENLRTAGEQLKVYRQAVLNHAFEGKLTEEWRDQNHDKLEAPEQLLERIKAERQKRHEQQLKEWRAAVNAWETNRKEGKKPLRPANPKEPAYLSPDELADLPSLPNGFTYTFLANIGELGRGKSRHRPRNDPNLFGGPYPFIQTGEVKAANRVIREYSQTYSEFGLAQSKIWPEGTLCITIAANIAETAFLGFDGCFPDSIVGFEPFDRIVLPEYVELFIKAVRVRIEAYAPATAQKNINLTTLENLVIPLCSIEEQQRLISEVEAILSTIDQNEVEIESNLSRAEMLRQAILKRAFSGQLVEQDPDDEPASELLARIKAEKEEKDKAKKSGKKKVKKKSKRKDAA